MPLLTTLDVTAGLPPVVDEPDVDSAPVVAVPAVGVWLTGGTPIEYTWEVRLTEYTNLQAALLAVRQGLQLTVADLLSVRPSLQASGLPYRLSGPHFDFSVARDVYERARRDGVTLRVLRCANGTPDGYEDL